MSKSILKFGILLAVSALAYCGNGATRHMLCGMRGTEDSVSSEYPGLKFTAVASESKVQLIKQTGAPTIALEYSTNGKDWSPYETTTHPTRYQEITLANVGDSVYFRATTNGNITISTTDAYHRFKLTGQIEASGNVMSLLDASCERKDIVVPGCFNSLLYGNSALITAPELPATTITNNCYDSMFFRCRNLISPPKRLPALSLCEECYKGMFEECNSLMTTPKLLAINLAERCYSHMFNGCSSLETTPVLDALELKDECYEYMFNGCTGIKHARDLPALFLAPNCYKGMFMGCTNLTDTPNIAALTMKEHSCLAMYDGCTSLTNATDLLAVNLATSCYSSMFEGCSSLWFPPQLPATDLAPTCYKSMFAGCSSLILIPELPAKKMENLCYWNMFNGCESLLPIQNIIATNTVSGCFEDMFIGATNVVVVNMSGMDSDTYHAGNPGELAEHDITITFIKPYDGLCIYSENGEGSVALKSHGGVQPISIEYSRDSVSWTNYTVGTSIDLPYSYSTVWFRAGTNGNSTISSSPDAYYQFEINGNAYADGDIMSLLDASCSTRKLTSPYCFYNLFGGCTNLLEMPHLTALVLSDGCYERMFEGCTELNGIQHLPAMVLATNCYDRMFEYDTLVTEANMSGISNGQYDSSIHGQLSTDHAISIQYVYGGLSFTAATNNTTVKFINHGGVKNVSIEYSTDSHNWYPYTFSHEIELPIKGDRVWFRSGENGNENFNDSINLEIVFEIKYGSGYASGNIMSLVDATLSKKTLPDYAFANLFIGCEGLLSAPELPATDLGYATYYRMFCQCEDITEPPELPATNCSGRTYYQMFMNCYSLTNSYDFPVCGRVGEECFFEMFGNCNNLVVAPNVMTNETNSSVLVPKMCYAYMFSGCESLKKAPEYIDGVGIQSHIYMFENCSSLEESPVLMSESLYNSCYQYMFSGCTNLTKIVAKFKSWAPGTATVQWVKGVNTTNGEFYCTQELPEQRGAQSYIPYYWTIIRAN